MGKKTGVELIAEEHSRIKGNINELLDEGEVAKNDELARMAAVFCLPKKQYWYSVDKIKVIIDRNFLWPKGIGKPRSRGRIKELTKAGALIAAEIDRLQSLTAQELTINL